MRRASHSRESLDDLLIAGSYSSKKDVCKKCRVEHVEKPWKFQCGQQVLLCPSCNVEFLAALQFSVPKPPSRSGTESEASVNFVGKGGAWSGTRFKGKARSKSTDLSSVQQQQNSFFHGFTPNNPNAGHSRVWGKDSQVWGKDSQSSRAVAGKPPRAIGREPDSPSKEARPRTADGPSPSNAAARRRSAAKRLLTDLATERIEQLQAEATQIESHPHRTSTGSPVGSLRAIQTTMGSGARASSPTSKSKLLLPSRTPGRASPALVPRNSVQKEKWFVSDALSPSAGCLSSPVGALSSLSLQETASVLASQDNLLERERQISRDRNLADLILKREHPSAKDSPNAVLFRSPSPSKPASRDKTAAARRSALLARTGLLDGQGSSYSSGFSKDPITPQSPGGPGGHSIGSTGWATPKATVFNGANLFRRS